MSPLPGFTDNLFRDRDDMIEAVYALLTPLAPYTSQRGARIRLPVSTGAHFDEIAAQLEGYARPLWAVGALLAGSKASSRSTAIDSRLDSWIRGLIAGTDPSSAEYWGDVKSTDQRMVEMEIISFALLSAPEVFVPESMDVNSRQNIISYLRSINEKPMPGTNWLWFRVMVNLGLVKACGVPYEELKPSMDADLAVLDGFYIAEGWSSDGKWDENERHVDYYSGSFAIQYSQLLYAKHAAEIDPKRSEVFRQRARDFSIGFWRYFDRQGAAIPFGRSLTYRFTFAAFWAMVAMVEVDLPYPLSLGVVKGLLLRHLRWWSKQADMFQPDGTLNIGFCYPNMYMSEDYNSPQSVYWCFKTFCAIALPADHPFWTCKEQRHPLDLEQGSEEDATGPSVQLLNVPRQILCDTGNHHFLLSSGQYCGWPLKATEAKYSKFAYSSAFGFSVPTGPLIQQMAPDSMCSLSIDGGETWKVRWKSQESRKLSASLYYTDGDRRINLETPILVNTWCPWKDASVKVETTLIPPTRRWPDWHIRIHKFQLHERVILGTEDQSFVAVESGFAISGRSKVDGLALPICDSYFQPLEETSISSAVEAVIEDGPSSLILSSAGASGIRQLVVPGADCQGWAKGEILKPDANTNLISQRTLIPTVRQVHFAKTEKILGTDYSKTESQHILFTVGVFAVSDSYLSRDEIRKRWEDPPDVRYHSADENASGDFIILNI